MVGVLIAIACMLQFGQSQVLARERDRDYARALWQSRKIAFFSFHSFHIYYLKKDTDYFLYLEEKLIQSCFIRNAK